ncbi:MAG: TraB/GumN family protein [Chitinophagales bacterium]
MRKLLLLLAAFLHLAVQAQYKSLLWKISGNGIETPSYLFGTMHTGDSRIHKLSDSVLPYFHNAKAYAMELDPDKAMDMGLIPKLMMGKKYSLKEMVPAPEYAFLDSIVKAQVGLPAMLFDNVAPVFVMTVLEAAGMGLAQEGGESSEVLDLYLHRLAKEKRKKVIGIETADEQLSALNSLTYQEQADMLTKEIQSLQNDSSQGPDLVRFYLAQELDSVAQMDDAANMPPKFYKALVTDRNVRMANRIGGFVKNQPTFIAVGALHLPGNEGVISLLRKKGYEVEPVTVVYKP